MSRTAAWSLLTSSPSIFGLSSNRSGDHDHRLGWEGGGWSGTHEGCCILTNWLPISCLESRDHIKCLCRYVQCKTLQYDVTHRITNNIDCYCPLLASDWLVVPGDTWLVNYQILRCALLLTWKLSRLNPPACGLLLALDMVSVYRQSAPVLFWLSVMPTKSSKSRHLTPSHCGDFMSRACFIIRWYQCCINTGINKYIVPICWKRQSEITF